MLALIVLCVILSTVALAEVKESAPSNVQITDSAGNPIESLTLTRYDYVTRIGLSCTVDSVKWSVDPQLPHSLRLYSDQSMIYGQVVEMIEKTVYTITASNASGNATATLSITVNGCQYGSFLYPIVEDSDQGAFKLLLNGETVVNQYLSNLGIKNAFCIPLKTYTYEFTCSATATSGCNVVVVDENESIFLSLYAAKQKTVSGEVFLVPVHAPVISVAENPTYITATVKILLFVDIQQKHENVTIVPALPDGVVFNQYRSSIQGIFMDQSVVEYTLFTSNELGDVEYKLTLAVDYCLENKHLIKMSRVQGIENEAFSLLSSSGAVLYHYEFDSNGYLRNFCLNEGEYRLLLQNTESTSWGKHPLLLHDENLDVFGEYTLPEGLKEIQKRIDIVYSIKKNSDWAYKKGSVDSDWYTMKNKAKDWNVGKKDTFGNYEGNACVYLRHIFSIGDITRYTAFYFDIYYKGTISIYVNGALLVQTTQDQVSDEYVRNTLAIAYLQSGSNIIAIQLQTTDPTSDIAFDGVLQPLSSTCIYRSESGVASDSQSDPDPKHPAKNAFNRDPVSYWTSSLPVYLRFTLDKDRCDMVNMIRVYRPSTNAEAPTSFCVIGTTNGQDKGIGCWESKTLLAKGSGYVDIRLNVNRCYNTYQFYFKDSVGHKSVSMSDIRLYYCHIMQCKKRWGLEEASTGEIIYQDCPWFSTGRKQMKCVDDNNQPLWVEDKSSCLPVIPESSTAYVDSSYSLFNVTYDKWKGTLMDGIASIMMSELTVKKSEISFYYYRDLTNNYYNEIEFRMRFSLEVEIGDYVLKHMKELDSRLNDVVTKKYSISFPGIRIATIEKPHLYNPIPWLEIVKNVIFWGLILAIILVIILRRRGKKSVKALKRNTKTEKASLLAGAN